MDISDGMNFKYCMTLYQDQCKQWDELVEYRPNMLYLRPTARFREILDQIVGKDNWMYQSQFETDTDCERIAIWFTSDSHRIATYLSLFG